MRAFRVSKQAESISLEEKIKLVEGYDIDDLFYVLREFEYNPKNYDKEVITMVINKLFESGITCL